MPSASDYQYAELNAALVAVLAADPAAGVEISQAVPAGQAWELLAVRFSLVTSAVVANRRVNLAFDDGANVFAKLGAPTAQTASQTIGYTFCVDAPFTQPSDMIAPIPRLRLPGGFRFRTITDSLDPGDNFGPPAFFYRRVG